MGIFGTDYSAITNAYDLSLSQVDHWCIRGDNDSCRCEDPLQPASRSEFKSWNEAHKANVAEVNFYKSLFGQNPTMIDEERGTARPPIDVAFVGESVVEAMDGRWLGKNIVTSTKNGEGQDRRKPDIGKVFEKLFNKKKGGPVEGVALGISGDNTANVLWRLKHDEMPYDFNPKVWWLVLGMNDLTRLQCSEEIVVLGILRVAEEIRLRKPDAKIVINSLLPMIDYQRMINAKKGEQPPGPKLEDFVDFKAEKDGVREGQVIKDAKKEFEKDVKGLHRKLEKSKRERRERGGKAGKDRAAATAAAMERKRKYLANRDKRLRDKKFLDNEKYRPKRPVSPLFPMIKKKVLPPVWPAVHLINDKLKEFCQKHESITFFDATQIFARDEGRGRHSLHSELISPRGHPSEIGFAVWEGEMMHRLHKMLVDDKTKEKPIFNEMDEQEPEQPDILKPVPNDAPQIDEEKDGEGAEHVSDGKAAEPPEPGNESMPDRNVAMPIQPPPEKMADDVQKATEDPPEKKEDEHVSDGNAVESPKPGNEAMSDQKASTPSQPPPEKTADGDENLTEDPLEKMETNAPSKEKKNDEQMSTSASATKKTEEISPENNNTQTGDRMPSTAGTEEEIATSPTATGDMPSTAGTEEEIATSPTATGDGE